MRAFNLCWTSVWIVKYDVTSKSEYTWVKEAVIGYDKHSYRESPALTENGSSLYLPTKEKGKKQVSIVINSMHEVGWIIFGTNCLNIHISQTG